MMPPSLQFQSVLEAFGQNGWHTEQIEGREILQTYFEAHHTRVLLVTQVFTNINALTIVGETQLHFTPAHLPFALKLLMLANKQLNIGSFEYDLEREKLVFRTSNLFEREKFDDQIISSMVHTTIAEVDRLLPYLSLLAKTPASQLPELSLEELLEREELLPPLPDEIDMEEEEL